jgi:Fic family protein
MKAANPPTFPSLLRGLDLTSERAQRLFTGRPEVDGEYYHWDDLAYRTPPAGLSRDEWWLSLLSARHATSVSLPLEDRGTSFGISNPDSLRRLVHTIDRDASGRIELPEPVTNPATRDRYVVAGLMEEAITSSQLEGASTTRRAAKEMLAKGRPPRNDSERMILSNYRAMEWVREHQHQPITPKAVQELHRVVVAGTLPADDAGRFRRADEDVRVIDVASGEVVHTPPPADSLPERLAMLGRFAAGEVPEGFLHPVVRAILLHFWIGFDHPFVDGNGRTARAVFYWQMLREGYWLTEFISISRLLNKARAQYARSYVRSESTHDATYFVLYQLQIVRRAIEDVFAYVRRKANEVRSIDVLLRGVRGVNRRQRQLLAKAVRSADAEFTIDAHRTSQGVTYQTARTDLLALAERGWLLKHQDGRAFVFTPAPDLDHRLRTARTAAPRATARTTRPGA